MHRLKVFILALLLTCAAGRAHALDAKEVTGNYELTGVMEMAGGLSLKPGQKYVAGFSYGAADWREAGSWKLEGDEVVLTGSHFLEKNMKLPSLFLEEGTRLRYQQGKLVNTDPQRKMVFLNPNKTPSPKGKGPNAAGEGRMRVKGKVIKIDSDVLIVKTDECMQFDARTLSDSILKTAKSNVGKNIDVEIPYSSIIGGGSCP
ncbi:MAG: hypothetical protein U1F57_05435 [bacterium]